MISFFMFLSVFYKLLELVTLFNFFFMLEVFLCFLLISVILAQKGSEDFSSSKSIFGPSAQAGVVTSITYLLIFAFAINTLVLNVLYKKEYKNFIIKGKA